MNFKRVVLKVGSALVAPDNQGCKGTYVLTIARFITQCQQAGKQVILVSSGSVAAGRHLVTHSSPYPSIETKQAMAAVGQMQMMANWQRFFDVPCSQLLITHGDLKDRQRYINIKNTLRVLLDNKIIPIVNENDTVATEELKVGDNDNLAALVALVADADSLIILTDIDGVFTKDPRKFDDAVLVPHIDQIDESVYAMAGTTSNPIATGGMKTKIQAAEKATDKGITTYIVNGQDPQTFDRLLRGENPGTCFQAKHGIHRAKKHWLKHTLKSHGSIYVDNGAARAVKETGASLLPSGIVEVAGTFLSGDSVDIRRKADDVILAKGISQYSARDLERIKGKNSEDIYGVLGYCPSKVVIHRDDMVII